MAQNYWKVTAYLKTKDGTPLPPRYECFLKSKTWEGYYSEKAKNKASIQASLQQVQKGDVLMLVKKKGSAGHSMLLYAIGEVLDKYDNNQYSVNWLHQPMETIEESFGGSGGAYSPSIEKRTSGLLFDFCKNLLNL